MHDDDLRTQLADWVRPPPAGPLPTSRRSGDGPGGTGCAGDYLASVTPQVTRSGTTVACEALWTDPSGQRLTALCGHAGVIEGTRFSEADLHLPSGTLISRGASFAW